MKFLTLVALFALFTTDAFAEKLCANGATTSTSWTFESAQIVSGAGCFRGTDCTGSASYTCSGGSWSMNTGSLRYSCGNLAVDGPGVQSRQGLDAQGRLLIGVGGALSFEVAPRLAVAVQVYSGPAGAQAAVTLTRR
jgi:hypothetical protein